jgi:hypothetical protein
MVDSKAVKWDEILVGWWVESRGLLKVELRAFWWVANSVASREN